MDLYCKQKRIGQFAPRFSDYSQEDSQEFLTFLLDGLHTELNVAKAVTESTALLRTVENQSTTNDKVML